MKVLLVEDDGLLATRTLRQLTDAGLVVDWAESAEDALDWPHPDLLEAIVLDLGLPGISGLEFIRAWRARRNTTPILVLSAASQWQEKVDCLNAGAEDYVVKPVRSEELIARVRALGRRASGRPLCDWIERGRIRIHPELGLVEVDGGQVSVTATEFRLLLVLMRRQGALVSSDQALNALYPLDAERQPNAIEAHVARLRRKVGNDLIVSRRGLGYSLGD